VPKEGREDTLSNDDTLSLSQVSPLSDFSDAKEDEAEKKEAEKKWRMTMTMQDLLPTTCGKYHVLLSF